VYGQPIEAYTRGRDRGRDGTWLGPWTGDGGRSRRAVLQCKHTGKPDGRLTQGEIKPELPKIRRHVAAGRCDVYLLMTNKSVSAATAEAIDARVRSVGVDQVIIQGYDALCELLAERKALRAMIPRLYGLGDLTEILDERAYAQAAAVLTTMHDDLARLVPVAARRAAHDALREHRFTLLLGPPGSGKTAIAASLAVGAIDRYDARVIKLSRPGELADRWNPHERSQLFWLDDAFGATSFDQTTTEEWNRITPTLEAALRGGAHVIATSRDYVYAAAKDTLKTSAFPRLNEATVVIKVEDLTTDERHQILYNHLRLGRQPQTFLHKLEPQALEAAAAHEHFLPELARRLGEPLFTKRLRYPTGPALIDFVARPHMFLREVLVNLDPPTRAALGLVHLRGGRLPSPYEAAPGDQDFLDRVGTTLSMCLRALTTLEGGLLRLVHLNGQRWWEFHHPSLTDAYRTWLAAEPELLREYLMSTPPEELARTVTCGDVELAGALIVPVSLQRIVAERFLSARPSGAGWEEYRDWDRVVCSFLAYRCDDPFLRTWVELEPEILRHAFSIGLWLGAHTTERDLALRLLGAGVAGDTQRRRVVKTLTGYALSAEDGSFLADDEWLRFFADTELADLDREVERRTLPRIERLVEAEQDAHRDGGYDASDELLAARRLCGPLSRLEAPD
jgi:hypothetical protein